MLMKKLIGPIRQILTLDQLPLKGALRDEQLEIFTEAGILIEGEFIQKVGSWTDLKQEFPELSKCTWKLELCDSLCQVCHRLFFLLSREEVSRVHLTRCFGSMIL